MKRMRLGNYFYILLASFTTVIFSSGTAMAATQDLNNMISNLLDNSVNLVGLVSIAAYLTGLTLGVKGVLDLKTHVVSGPREMPIRTPIIELIVSGMLLAFPFLYEVIINTTKGNGAWDVAGANFYTTGSGISADTQVYVLVGGAVTPLPDPTAACADGDFDDTIGGIVCAMWENTSTLPGLFSGFSYIAGLTFMYFAAVALKESVENPQQTSLWVPFQRFVVAALLLIFPYTMETLIQTFFEDAAFGMGVSGWNLTDAGGTDQTLDMFVANFIFNIYGVFNFAIVGFCYIAGMTLILIGIFRLLKTMQEGPRGPGGIGTIMTFITGTAMLAIAPTMATFSETLFGTNVTATEVDLTIPGGGLVDYENRMVNFISAVLAYMLILGWVSFVRGLFIFRQVAEGDQQASMMSAVTHLLGGAILVNLGPFLNTVQDTLGPVAGLPTVDFL